MHLRFFVSSPGDVLDERTFAQQVIEQELPKDPLLRGQITCEAMRWDDPNAPTALPATETPQEAVNRGLTKPSECDATIVILWSRLGTPLPDTYKRPDGSRYLSGTEWEFEDAAAAKQPYTLVYRRKGAPLIAADDPNHEEKFAQYKRVNEFFAKFRNTDGSLKGAFIEYETPQAFRDRLRLDLRAFVERRLKEEQKPAAAKLKAPPPYGVIARALRGGQVIPVLGPNAVHSSRGADAAASANIPEALDLIRSLAKDTDYQGGDQLAEVASYYEIVQSRGSLLGRLREILDPSGTANGPTPPLYALLAEISAPLLIVTTHYDTLLEQAFRSANKPYDLVAYPADRKDLANAVLWWPHGATEPHTPAPNELDIDLTRTTVIFKMYGSVQPNSDTWDGFVITEEDNVEFLSRVASKSAIPSLFSAYFSDHSLLFLGLGLRDWNVRTLLRSLSRYFGRRNDDEHACWAIDDEYSELETRIWGKRGVFPYQVSIEEFVEKLRAQLPK